MFRAIGAVVARFLDTEEVTGSNPVSPTSITVGQRPVSTMGTGLLPCSPGACTGQANDGDGWCAYGDVMNSNLHELRSRVSVRHPQERYRATPPPTSVAPFRRSRGGLTGSLLLSG